MSDPVRDFEALFLRMSDPGLIVDCRGETVLSFNPAFRRLLIDANQVANSGMVSDFMTLDQPLPDSGEYSFNAGLKVGPAFQSRIAVESRPCKWQDEVALLWLIEPRGRVADTPRDTGDAALDCLREVAGQLDVVNKIVAAVNTSRSIEQVFELASSQIRTLIAFHRATIALCDTDGNSLRVFAVSGEEPGSLDIGAIGPLHGSVTEMALRERRMIAIPELDLETRFNAYPDLKREGFRSAVCCPLFSNGKAIGSLNLTCREPDAYGDKQLRALGRLTAPLAVAIEKVLLLEQAEKRSQEMEAAARREELGGRIARELLGSLDPSLIIQNAVDSLGRGVGADRAHVTIVDQGVTQTFVSYEYLARPEVPSLHGTFLPVSTSPFVSKVLASNGWVSAEIKSESASGDPLLELYRRFGTRTVLAASLIVAGERRGTLELHASQTPRRWSDDDARLLATVASEMSIALMNSELYEASRRRGEELEGLYKISRVFSTLRDTSDLYGKLTRAIAELVGGDMCLIATYDRKRKEMRAESPAFNVPQSLIDQFRFTVGPDDARDLVRRSGRPFFSNEPAHDERFKRYPVEKFGVRSVLGLPMRIKGELVGFICVANKPGGFTSQDARTLEIFTAQATETIANARLFASMQRQAEREAVVNRLLLTMQQMTDARKAIDMVVERLADVLDLDRCTAVLFGDNDRSEFRGEWCAKGVPSISQDLVARERSPVFQWLSLHRQPLVVSDVKAHSFSVGIEEIIGPIGAKSFAAVPIMYNGRVVGAISADQTNSVRNWAEDDIDLLTAVAAHVGALLENAYLISQLKEASRVKDEFLATLSHELRTPLTAIRGWVELMSENPAVAHDEELTEGVDVIKSSSASLSQLISDLLDLSRIQRRSLQLERAATDINVSVIEATQIVKHMADQRRIDIQLDLDGELPLAFVDPQRMHQVVWNLLTNAIKFTPAGGRVTVRSRLIGSDGILIQEGNELRWIAVEVEDTGEGIPADFLPFVWDRFRQADSSSTRRHRGLGIGLTLVKELVEAHGGVVDARSMGVGASFTIRIPVIPLDGASLSPGVDHNEFPA
jgi:GAF domain-containing protein